MNVNKSLFVTVVFMFVFVLACRAQVNVKGYYRKDGTYVQPHVRTRPDNTITNNYSYPGNYNPNTGTITDSGSTKSLDGYPRTDVTYQSYTSLNRDNVPEYSKRNYQKDKKGRYNGFYTVQTDSSGYSISENIYYNDVLAGNLTTYRDGTTYVYDNYNNFVKIIKRKKRKN